jgi:micrococcal nuclease
MRAQPRIRRRRRRRIAAPWLLIVVVAASLGVAYFQTWLDRSSLFQWGGVEANASFTLCAEQRQPNCVIDGDTIHYNGTRICVADIDAPETHNAQCASELALGERATERLLELLNDGPFFFVRQGARDLDVYGRELRVIERDGRSLGGILVSEGLARLWDGARHPWCE